MVMVGVRVRSRLRKWWCVTSVSEIGFGFVRVIGLDLGDGGVCSK